jgi:hypothetical protein
MNSPNRSGDIVLLFKDDTDGSSLQRYTCGVSCKSWHGSLNRSDSYVPFIVAYPGGNVTQLNNIIEEICPSGQCDYNTKLSDLIKKMGISQYSTQ